MTGVPPSCQMKIQGSLVRSRPGPTPTWSLIMKYLLRSSWSFSSLIPEAKCCLFVCFVALRPKSTAMVRAGRSVHLTTLFPGQA